MNVLLALTLIGVLAWHFRSENAERPQHPRTADTYRASDAAEMERVIGMSADEHGATFGLGVPDTVLVCADMADGVKRCMTLGELRRQLSLRPAGGL